MLMLTRNFARAEFDVHERPPAALEPLVQQMANLLQWFRDLARSPLTVSSYYRSPARNAEVGGVQKSEHLEGRAADVVPEELSKVELTRRLLEAEAQGRAPQYGQFIVYLDTEHIHISLPRHDGRPNGQKLVSWTPAGQPRAYAPLTSLAQLKGATASMARRTRLNAGVVLGLVLLGLGGIVLEAIAGGARRGGWL